VIATLAFFSSFIVMRWVPFEFMPPEDRGLFMVRADLPTGTALDVSRELGERVAAEIRRLPGVEGTFVTIGAGTQGEVNRADVQVNLSPKKQRAFTQKDAMEHVRAMLGGRKDALYSVEQVDAVGGSSAFRQAMIQFNLRGRDYGELNREADEIIVQMRKSGGYVDIDTTYRGGKPEVAVTIDRDRAADLGVPVAVIAMTLRTFLAGEKATEVTVDADRLDVQVRLDAKFRRRPEDLAGLKVRAQSGQLVRLGELVTLGQGTGPAKIERQNRQRQVTILANLQGKPLGDAVTEVETWAKASVPSHMAADRAGFGDIMKESIGHMGSALLLAIVMVYLILAAQFESFVHPFTILLSLPLSLVGALLGLAIGGQSLNIFSMIGVIMLMGLVTKNAILLVDYTNQLRAQGMPRRDALLQAGVVRLRPILMTTAAMIFGMIPVALALSEGGEQRAPMAVTVIGGLITSTLLTLVVVPVAYAIIDGGIERVSRRQPVPRPAEEGASGS
jgi:HAE1 family hydrophobic/amphiphilic exporter-1